MVQSLIAPGSIGYLEILINHAPIITSLQLGKLVITDKNQQKHFFAITGGILEMVKNKAIILGDDIESATEIDIDRAKAARERALMNIEFPSGGISTEEATQALLRAENRIKVFQEYKGMKKG
jgi:F-type H+-transporting ATPase subunit epsilon